jgi:hypothetical protein
VARAWIEGYPNCVLSIGENILGLKIQLKYHSSENSLCRLGERKRAFERKREELKCLTSVKLMQTRKEKKGF